MARGGNNQSSTHLDTDQLTPRPVALPLHDPAAPVQDLYGNRLDLYGVILLDEISSTSRSSSARQRMWHDLAQSFPGGIQTMGDMFIHFWDDPATVQRLRKYTASLPFRMVVACGYQNEHQAPMERLSIYRQSSLGLMAFGAECEVKLQEGNVLWAGSEDLSSALESQSSAWRSGFSLEEHELVRHAHMAEVAHVLDVSRRNDEDKQDARLSDAYLKQQDPAVLAQAHEYLAHLDKAHETYKAVKAAGRTTP